MLKTILNRPVAVLTVFIVAVIVSLVLSTGIPLDLYPQMDVPIMAVSVTYPGAGPEEVEEDIVRVIEGELSGLEGMDTMTSTSAENYGVIILSMDYGVDLNDSMAEVRTRLDRISGSLPDDADSPVLQKFDPSSLPILSLALEGDRSEKDMTLLAENTIIPALESLEGVASVSLEGLRESIVRVDVEQEALESYGLSLSMISGALSSQNLQLGAGSFEESGLDILIRTSGRYESLSDLENTVIMSVTSSDGTSVAIRLSDLAEVSWDYAESESLVRINGEPGISLQVRKGSQDNSVAVSDAIRDVLPDINTALPDGVELSLLTDSTGEVRSNLSQVTSAVLYGILFAVLILFVFLRQWKSTFIAGLSIPIALVISLAALSVTGRTLNIVTLVGLSVGVGLIVDSSIVVIENIYRLRQKGAPMTVSAFRGASEMMAPIIASTLTTVAVFLPLLIYKNDLGFMGIFFGELAFIIIVVLLASLLVAAILVPVLSSRFLTIRTRREKPIRNRFLRRMDNAMEQGFTGMENGFGRLLTWVIGHKKTTIGVLAALVAGSAMLFSGIDVSMMPGTPESTVNVDARFATGTAIGEAETFLLELQRRVGEELETEDSIVITAAKSSGSMEITFVDGVSADAEVRKTKRILRNVFADYPEVEFTFTGSREAQMMSSSGVDVSITGSDWDSILVAADEAAAILNGIDGIEEVENGALRGLPQVEVVFDRQAVYEQGLSIAAVASELRSLTAGTTATTFIENGETYDVILQLSEGDRSSVTDLERMFVTNGSGQRISLSQVATVERSAAPTEIIREDQTRTIHVVGTLADDAAARDVTLAAEAAMTATATALPGVTWGIGGEMDDFAETGTTMGYVALLAVLLVIAVMVAQFESFKDPLIIFLAMPMMLVGIVILFRITGVDISIVAMMGMVLLLGIVVNNGIVLVDHARLMRRRGMGVVEAAVESGRSRLRPVLMTSLTTILAMVPLAFFPGEGGQMMQPMALAIVGGLTTAMVGTLVLVPMYYTIAHRKERDDYGTRRQRRADARIARDAARTAAAAAAIAAVPEEDMS